ncbi:MAG: hypothetical protein WBM86_20600 [Waterburya sp.]
MQELILEVIEPEDSVYDNMLLLRITSYVLEFRLTPPPVKLNGLV